MAQPVRVNGKVEELELPMSVAALVARTTGSPSRLGYAVARNGQIVPRSTWDEVRIEPGDELEITAPFAGG